mmetsp:Transcript_30674/g.47058  ORF Transcript_30674/g.47058 Transcript_30674/m.47058 type:complete len:159 (+) Transcript_30674:777-1253(+)
MLFLLLFLTFILFKAAKCSGYIILIEKDQVNRYRYLLDTIQDSIYVTHNDEIRFCNSKASNLQAILTNGDAFIDHAWIYKFQESEEGRTEGRGLPEAQSLKDLLTTNFEKTSSCIFTTHPDLVKASSLTDLQATIDRLSKEGDPSRVPLFVQVKLFYV